jgi:hypothetical protein
MTQETLNLENFRQITATPFFAADSGAIKLTDVIIEQREILARTHPYDKNGPSISVPPGYGLFFSMTSNNGWTDNKDIGSNPGLEGYDYADETECLPKAKRAQLFGIDTQNNLAALYDPSADRSRGGTQYWANENDFTWELKWYMNDRDSGYGDNLGTANVDFTIFRII